ALLSDLAEDAFDDREIQLPWCLLRLREVVDALLAPEHAIPATQVAVLGEVHLVDERRRDWLVRARGGVNPAIAVPETHLALAKKRRVARVFRGPFEEIDAGWEVE